MQRLIKLLILSISLGSVFFLGISPVLQSWAAPVILPSCGHSSISNSNTRASGLPDIAHSLDTDQHYTAVVWSEGTDNSSTAGTIRLAYSDVLTDSRSWNQIVVDSNSGDGNRDPTIAFDPDSRNLVHITYQKNNGIHYKRCDLDTGTCPLERALTSDDNGTGAQLISDRVPQIAVIDGTLNTVVIVYLHQDDTFATTRRYLEYAFILDSGGGVITTDRQLTNNDKSQFREENPTVAFSNGKVHVAYARDRIINDLDGIEYVILTEGTLGNQLLAVSDEFELNSTFSDTAPLFPTVAADGNNVAIVWQVTDFGGLYSLGYVTSADNGTTWDNDPNANNYYKYLFTGDGSSVSGRTEWDTDDANQQFLGGLKPDAYMDSSTLHVAWQAKANNRHDIYYSKLTSSVWGNGAPALLTTTTTVSYTNVTTIYRSAEFSATSELLSKVEPSLVYGEPGERLQLVYMSQTTTGGWDIYYNGWQIGGDDPPYDFNDTDCDFTADADEINPPGANCGSNPVGDCDGDGIPNFLDEDSDGDGSNDFVEGTNPNFNPYDGEVTPPKVFLPIILKAS